MERYEAELSLTFDVTNAAAVRRAAWELVADRREIEREGKDVFADRATATIEDALSVLLGRSDELRDALQALAASTGGMTFTGQFASPDHVHVVLDT